LPDSSSDKHFTTRRRIEIWCGKDKAGDIDWAAASDPSSSYNCFGFALGDLQWWEPPKFIDGRLVNDETFWPTSLPADEKVDINAYVEAAKTVGFFESVDCAWEEGLETIMLFFTERNREFQHAAKQVSPGMWASKMGFGSDVTHVIDGIDRIDYGYGRLYMKRPWPVAVLFER
jgi:hypothetical protein